MMHKLLGASVAALALLAITATPARAQTQTYLHTFDVEVDATCACNYEFAAWGRTFPSASFRIDYSFTVTSGGQTYTVASHVDTNSDVFGYFQVIVPGLPLPGDCKGTVSFALSTSPAATLTFLDGSVEPLTEGWGFGEGGSEGTLLCESPPEGKTFDIGPSSMEGHLLIRPGDWISGGYSFVFKTDHPNEMVTVSSHMTLPFKCANGTAGQFVINLGTQNYLVPAGNKTWQPTGDANSVLSWAGSGKAPEGCGPGQIMDNSKGAIFEATVSQTPDTGQLLNWRFKYRDPNAKGKGNVDCLDTTDPRRAKADVCGASWSGTVTDP